MSNIIIPKTLDNAGLISAMAEDAKYEIASDMDAERTALVCADKIKGRPNPPKIPKMFICGNCLFNCAYCGCRASYAGRPNYTCDPRKVAELAVKAAEDNGHGVFVTSAIYRNPDYTQELIAESVRIMRQELEYTGFIHAKIMPGADSGLIASTGLWADRLSVNIEVANSEGYSHIAKQKSRSTIITPMRTASYMISEAKEERRPFARTQTTQLMAGSTGEDDRTIMLLARALYDKILLKRVYYTAYAYRNEALGYEDEHLQLTKTPYWRMARLYQADRLMQIYGFTPEDILPEASPFLEEDIDPKAAWALRHREMYPVEVNTADYETLIRVPGIGVTYAKRIIEARRHCTVTHELLKKMRVSLKRAVYFITCNGKYAGESAIDCENLRDYVKSGGSEESITDALTECGR